MIKDIEIYSPDLITNAGEVIDVWSLPSQDDVDISIRVLVTFFERDAEELFDTKIITGRFSEKYFSGEEKLPYDGKVFFYDRFLIPETLNDIVDKIRSCDRDNAMDTIDNIRNIMEWDFEGM